MRRTSFLVIGRFTLEPETSGASAHEVRRYCLAAAEQNPGPRERAYGEATQATARVRGKKAAQKGLEIIPCGFIYSSFLSASLANAARHPFIQAMARRGFNKKL
jgi:hypothetical protein